MSEHAEVIYYYFSIHEISFWLLKFNYQLLLFEFKSKYSLKTNKQFELKINFILFQSNYLVRNNNNYYLSINFLMLKS